MLYKIVIHDTIKKSIKHYNICESFIVLLFDGKYNRITSGIINMEWNKDWFQIADTIFLLKFEYSTDI